jgi:hypothetical protein
MEFFLVAALAGIGVLTSCDMVEDPKAHTLASEAEEFAKPMLERDMLHCGDRWWQCYSWDETNGCSGCDEITRLTFEAKSEEVSEADRLNGIEWRGTITRLKGPSRHWTNGKPDELQDEPFHWGARDLEVFKQNGKWNYRELGSFILPRPPPSGCTCENLPSAKP